MLKGREILIYLSLINEGNWEDILQDIKRKRKDFTEEDVKTALSSIKSNTITIIDDEYPDYLKRLFKPPIVLFYYGDISLMQDPSKSISVVGSRKCSDYGERMTNKIVSELASKEFVIVSGLAKGIDSIAHKAALSAGGKTIAVLGSGIDNCYPKENYLLYEEIKKNHLLISEYPNDVLPNKENFPIRNRIIAYLSRTLLITEASKNSGSFITTSYALQNGSDICCVPHDAEKGSACNHLIKEGAKLVESAKDVIEEIQSL